MIIATCKKCGGPRRRFFEIGLPLPRYTHCDDCYSEWMLESFKEVHTIIDDMKAQGKISDE